MEQPTLSVLRRPSSDDRWLLTDNLHKQSKTEVRGPLLRARLSSQELFLSVVMEWQQVSLNTSTDTVSDGYTTPTSDDSDVDAASPTMASSLLLPMKSKRMGQASCTNRQNAPHDTTTLQIDCITKPVKMVGVYTPVARRVMLQKYMVKRARRLSQHKVRYRVRKTLANARPRVKGRFVKTVQPLTAATVVAQQMHHQQAQ